jgi:cystathionine gamma-synthase
LGLRVERHNQNALAVARFLSDQERIAQVWYPLLEEHPDYEVASRQLKGGGGVVSFTVKGTLEDAGRFIDALSIPTIAPSLGGVESLIEQPALMSFYELTSEQRAAIGISDTLVRFAVGIEDTTDLIHDVAQGLRAIA